MRAETGNVTHCYAWKMETDYLCYAPHAQGRCSHMHICPVCAHKHKHALARTHAGADPPLDAVPVKTILWKLFLYREKKKKSMKGDGDLASNSKVGYPG